MRTWDDDLRDWTGSKRYETYDQIKKGAGLNDGLFSETMDFRDFPSVLSAVHIAQS